MKKYKLDVRIVNGVIEAPKVTESPDGNLIELEDGEQVIKWHSIEKEGNPKKEGKYLVTVLALGRYSVCTDLWHKKWKWLDKRVIKAWAELPKEGENEESKHDENINRLPQ